MPAPFSLQADWNLLARPASDEAFAAVARDRWPACLREIERLTGQLAVVRAERDQARHDIRPANVRDIEQRIVALAVDVVTNRWNPEVALLHDMTLLVAELETARAAAAQIGGGS